MMDTHNVAILDIINKEFQQIIKAAYTFHIHNKFPVNYDTHNLLVVRFAGSSEWTNANRATIETKTKRTDRADEVAGMNDGSIQYRCRRRVVIALSDLHSVARPFSSN